MPSKHGGARIGAGRKKGKIGQAKRDLSDMAKDHAELALKVLVEVAQSGESEAARVSAANALLDRGYGRPAQAVQVTGRNGGPVEHDHKVSARDMTDDELARIIANGGA
jgi:hypothetical protein